MVEFHVLKCSDCETFQVFQVTKSQKWKCKLCGSKQSIIKVYGRGTGADCRKHVQKLNTVRGELDLLKEETSFLSPKSTITSHKLYNEPGKATEQCSSQWTKYISSPVDVIGENERDSDPTGAENGNIFITTDRAQYNAEIKTAKYKRKMAFKEKQYSQSCPPSIMKKHKGSQIHQETDSEICLASSQASKPNSVSSSYHSSSYPLSSLEKRDTTMASKKNSVSNASCSRSKMNSGYNFHTPSYFREDSSIMREAKINSNVATHKAYNFSNRISNNECEKNHDKAVTNYKSPNVKTNLHADTNSSGKSSSKWASFIENEREDFESDEDDSELAFSNCGQLTMCLENGNNVCMSKPF